MFHNKNGLFYSKHSDKNQIELIQISLTDNNKSQLTSNNSTKQNKAMIIPIDSKAIIIKYSFFNDTLIIIQQNMILLYKNYNDKKSLLTSSYKFIKEDNAKVKIYQTIPLQLYIVSFGKVIYLIRILNENRLVIQTYRMQSISIQSILLSEVHKDFSGENISITCRVNYDINPNTNSTTSSSSFAIQSFLLPYIESEIITNHSLFFGQFDPLSLIKIKRLNTPIVMIYSKKGKQCITTLSNTNPNINKTFELIELDHCSIDQIALIPLTGYIIFFSSNSNIVIYQLNTLTNDVKLISRLVYNKEGKYLLKHKAVMINEKIVIAAFNTISQLKLITINKEMNKVESEEYIMQDYSFVVKCDIINKEFNRDYLIKVIEGKHCEIGNSLFYNTIIHSIKYLEGVTAIVYSSKIELIAGKDINQTPLSIINYSQTNINILDYDICFVKDKLFLFILFIDHSTEHCLLVLFHYNSYHHSEHIENNNSNTNSNNKSLLFNYSQSDKVTVKTLLDSSKTMSYISLISDLHLLVILSPYGEVEFYSYDENGSIALLYHFTFSFHSCEITEMKNEFENEGDLNEIFRLDRRIHVLSSYCLIDAFVYNEKAKIISNEKKLFDEKYIVIIVNFGVIVFRMMKNGYTGIRKIVFYDQINKEIGKNATGFNRESIRYDSQTKKFELK